ncbi:MAG: hypothetical protein GY939_15090 [Actinomycetia bacterium]|nr:hypothetical protein [Actinomycetes bacterium]
MDRFDYEVEEIRGFATSVTLRASADNKISMRSASPVDSQDLLWLGMIVFSDDAPPFVFGGVDASVDQATLINTTGEEIPLELIALEGRDWLLFTQELPVSWATNGEVDFEAVATSGNLELAREQVTSL